MEKKVWSAGIDNDTALALLLQQLLNTFCPFLFGFNVPPVRVESNKQVLSMVEVIVYLFASRDLQHLSHGCPLSTVHRKAG